jgi:hypothetical protein
VIFDEDKYLKLLADKTTKLNYCKSDCDISNDISDIVTETGIKLIENKNIEHAATYCLERYLFLSSEFSNKPLSDVTIGKNRILTVNPGANNLGREQRFLHYYVILAEFKDMFIGVPITNMAFDKVKTTYYLRHPFEAELKNPSTDMKKKPFNEFWITKPSVADVRNISGLDKRRIIDDNLFKQAKYAPKEYILSIKSKMIELFNLQV